MLMLAQGLTVAAYAGLVVLVVWLLAVRPRRPVKDGVTALLQLLGIYTFLLGLLSTAGVFQAMQGLQRDLTSRNPLEFLAANCIAFAFIFLTASVALDPATTASTARFLLGLPVLLGCALVLFLYAIVHFLAIVPLAYFGYVITSVPIDAVLSASSDAEIKVGSDTVRIKQLLQQNETALRNFAVALPAFATSAVLRLAPLLRRAPDANAS